MSKNHKKLKYYAVAAGWKTGIFQEPWDIVKEYVYGFKHAAFKGFWTLEEAQAYMMTGAMDALKRSFEQKEASKRLKEKHNRRNIEPPEFIFN